MEPIPSIVPVNHSADGIIMPAIRDMDPPAKGILDAPLPMPKTPDDIKKKEKIAAPVVSAPVISGPVLSMPVELDEQLYPLPSSATPFISSQKHRITAEYLLWWTNSYSTPPLVTSGPATSDGALGQPGVSSLHGYQSTVPQVRSGVRIGGEWWLGQREVWGIEGHVLFLTQRGEDLSYNSNQFPLLARPFNDLNTGMSSAELVAFPGLFAGSIAISNSTSFWGGDLNLRRKLWQGCSGYCDAIGGFRYLRLNEQTYIQEQSTRLAPDPNPVPGDPSQFIVGGQAFDRFRTSNQFYGGQLGLAFGFTRGRWSLDMRALLGVGSTQSVLEVDGAQSVNFANGAVVNSPGGLLALNSNIGRHYKESLSIVPEATFNLGYDVSDHCRVFIGYNFLYWSNVLRPGDQIDTGLDVNRIPNFRPATNTLSTIRPVASPNTRDFFAQGLNFGLMFKW